MKNRVAASVLLIVLIAAAAVAQDSGQDPNMTRGVSAAGKLYSFHDIDAVNQFSGHLTVRIPIGQAHPVGALMSAQLMLTYNSSVWDYKYEEGSDVPGGPQRLKRHAYPERYSNAGLGWILSMGQLVPAASLLSGGDPPDHWLYRAPDGSTHDFGFGDDPVVATTIDGSFLRLKRFPANTSVAVDHREVEFPDGSVHEFAPDGKLTKIRERYGHWIKVSYQTDQWVITHGYASTATPFRTVTVNFATRTNTQANFQKVVSSVVFPAAGGTTATYQFTYADTSIDRDGCGDLFPNDPMQVTVPLLTAIDFPEGASYKPSYQTTLAGAVCAAGTIKKLELPTGGSIQWGFGVYQLPVRECDEERGWSVDYPGVISRQVLDRDDLTILESSTYKPELMFKQPAPMVCHLQNTMVGLPPTEFRNTVTTRSGERTTHYFSANMAGQSQNGNRDVEYGLPFSREPAASDTRFLSSETAQCTNADCTTLTAMLRKTFLTYGYDPSCSPEVVGPCNPRVTGERTVWPLDTSCSTGCYTDIDRPDADYDGYGHLQKTIAGGNYPGVAIRTSYQHFTPVATSDTWMLNTYDYSWTEQSGMATKQEFAFDADTGVLKSTRTLKSKAAVSALAESNNDLLSASCRDSRGFLSSERFFGGDVQPIRSGNPCTLTPAPSEYQIDHQYTFDSTTMAPTKHTSKYSGTTFFTADEDLDKNTGLVTASRDSAGIATTFTYDGLGRPVEVKPTGAGWVRYSYSNGTASNPASVRAAARTVGAADTATPLTDSYAYFDGLGRVIMEKRQMPEGWSTVMTSYDSQARSKSVSTPQFATTSPYEPDFVPLHETTQLTDIFGRVQKITAADGKITDIAYKNSLLTPNGVGSRFVERTVDIAQQGGLTGATTREEYDVHGQLIDVTEANQTETKYTYDSAGRLASVCMNASSPPCQQRSFDYDGRGFMTAETHPEIGKSGNGTVRYDDFDARGHAGRKLVSDPDAGATASGFDLRYSYDTAERLHQVDEIVDRSAITTRPLKVFTFGDANTTVAPVDYRQGKLQTSVRYNYPVPLPSQAFSPPTGKFIVTETMHYQNDAGLLTSRDTKIEHDNPPSPKYTMQQFTQSYTYNDLGQAKKIGYPTCVTVTCAMGAPLSELTNTFSYGHLTAVAGYATSLTHHANGMVDELVHGQNGGVNVKDKYTADSGLPRPASIAFTGWDDCVPPTPSITAATQVCPSSTANTASVTAVTGATYLWQITSGNGAITSGSASAAMQYTAGPSGTVTFRVTVTTSCGSGSDTRTVSIAQPTAQVISPNQTINPGQSVTIQAALTGTPPWSITWMPGNVAQNNILSSAASRTVSPTATTTYSIGVVSDNNCTGTASGSVTITVATAPPAPSNFMTWKSLNNSKDVLLQWDVVPSATSYRLERAAQMGSWSQIFPSCQQVGSVMQCTDSFAAQSIATPKAYVYRVSAVANGLTSGPSAMDYATVADQLFTDEPLLGSVTRIRGRHVSELRAAIDAVRSAAGLSLRWGPSYSPQTGRILALHFFDPSRVNDLPNATDLRNGLDEAVLAIRGGRLAYTLPAPAPGGRILAYQVEEIRAGVK